MNATNPFQVPSCFQIDHERRRRERFKRTFIAVLAASVLLLVGLLIEGCRNEQARVAGPADVAANIQQPPSNLPAVAAEPAPVPVPQQNTQPAVSHPESTVPKVSITPVGRPAMVYVVKAGDSLTRIARTHGTTVKAIEASNGLASDHIAIGMKLRIPTT